MIILLINNENRFGIYLEKDMEMTPKEKMHSAKQLIQAKKYADAKAILKTVNHPKAQEWLAKLDKIAPDRRATSTRNRWLLGIAIGLGSFGAAYCLAVVFDDGGGGFSMMKTMGEATLICVIIGFFALLSRWKFTFIYEIRGHWEKIDDVRVKYVPGQLIYETTVRDTKSSLTVFIMTWPIIILIVFLLYRVL